MPATLPGGRQAAAQRQGGQGRGAHWTPPRRSAARLPQGCSRCAGGGKPRGLPRGIDGRTLFGGDAGDEGVDRLDLALAMRRAAQELREFGEERFGILRGLDASLAVERDHATAELGREVVEFDLAGDGGGHFALLGFGSLRATHDQIIEHHAPIVKSFLQQNYRGGSKPSNA